MQYNQIPISKLIGVTLTFSPRRNGYWCNQTETRVTNPKKHREFIEGLVRNYQLQHQLIQIPGLKLGTPTTGQFSSYWRCLNCDRNVYEVPFHGTKRCKCTYCNRVTKVVGQIKNKRNYGDMEDNKKQEWDWTMV